MPTPHEIHTSLHTASLSPLPHLTSLTCVLTGATSGIGLSTLLSLTRTLRSSTFYVIGRSASRWEDSGLSAKVEDAGQGRGNVVVFLEGEVSLIAGVDEVCEEIYRREGREKGKVDLLVMSAGMLPFQGPICSFPLPFPFCPIFPPLPSPPPSIPKFKTRWQGINAEADTRENLDTCFTLSYYHRLRLTTLLLPLLRRSTSPRVLSILAAGTESAINTRDLGLFEGWSFFGTVAHTTTMMTLAFDHLAAQSENREVGMVFMHAHPGWVRTGIFVHLEAKEGASVMWRGVLRVLRGVAWGALWWGGVSAEEAGERQAWQVLMGEWEGKGECLRLGANGEELGRREVLEGYRREGLAVKVWEFTEGVFERVVAERKRA